MAVLALALTGCGGADDPETGAPVSTESSSGGASPAPNGPAGSGSSGSSPASVDLSPEASADAFVPASSEGPAQNMPVPEMPEEARERTKEGLEAALKYWWEANYFLKSTGNAAPLLEVSADSCEICNEIGDSWPAIYEASGWADMEMIVVDVLDIRFTSGSSPTLLTFEITDGPSLLYRPGGELVKDGSLTERQTSYWSGTATYSTEKRHWVIEDLRLVRTADED
ncbi:MAG: DUF6318 family protein [Micrococcus sp.]|nr:DUF6318 family protein [Micrococcus sp.]